MSIYLGFITEQQALQFLEKQGLICITKNFRCRWGEIDLIMQDKVNLIFVEVRSRVSQQFGNALESITASKQRKILKTAAYYLMKHKYDTLYPRFDVLCLQGNSEQFIWIKEAFQMHAGCNFY